MSGGGRYQGGVKDRARQGLRALGEGHGDGHAVPDPRPGFVPTSPPWGLRTHRRILKRSRLWECGSHFTHHRKHVQEVVQGHVAIPILGEDLGDPLSGRSCPRDRKSIPYQVFWGSVWFHRPSPSWEPLSTTHQNSLPPMIPGGLRQLQSPPLWPGRS